MRADTSKSASSESVSESDKISRYTDDFLEIERCGRGGYGSVFRCLHELDRKIYAVKKISFNEEKRSEVLREVIALSSLYHNNVVRYHQAWIENSYQHNGEEDAKDDSEDTKDVKSSGDGVSDEGQNSYLFIQMEYCTGALDKLLEQKIDNETAWNIFEQILKGIAYLHANGTIHRDLTPKNILLDDFMRIKISDFGLAKVYEDNEPLYTSADELGNELYRAPEMNEKDSEYDYKVDIFSLGLILFELLYWFETKMERGKVLTDLKKNEQFPASADDIKDQHKNLILSLLSKSPKDRPSAEKVLQEHIWKKDEQNDPASTSSRGRYFTSNPKVEVVDEDNPEEGEEEEV